MTTGGTWRRISIPGALFALLVLAACGNDSVNTADRDGGSSDVVINDDPAADAPNDGATDSDAQAQVATLQALFEANPWRIVDRSGFDTVLPDGIVTFETFGADDIITVQVLPCGRSSGRPILWNEQGFVITESANATGGIDTTDQECGPGDDLFELLPQGIDPEQFIVTIASDGTTATVSKGERTLTLSPTTIAPPPLSTVAPPVTAASTTTTTTTTVPAAAPSALSPFAPQPAAILSGQWDVVSIHVDNELVDLGAFEPRLTFQGRNFSGSDGCNGFGGGGATWSDDGSFSFNRDNQGNTDVGCADHEDVGSAFHGSIGGTTSWGFTSTGNLVFAGSTSRLELAPAGSAELLDDAVLRPLGDTTLELIRETEQFAGLPDDAELPQLLITNAGTTATLRSSDCEVTYTVTLPDDTGEGPAAFDGPDPSTCPEGTTSRAVADVLTKADYGLSLTVEDVSLLQLWIGPRSAIFFASPGSGFDG